MPPSKPAPRARLRPPSPGRGDTLARSLATDILDGRRPVGSVLPSEAELAATHQTTLTAVRGAMRHLETLGLVTRSRGAAARVVSGELRATYLVAPDGDDAASGYVGATRVAVERQRQALADAELAMLLGVEEGTAWLHLSGLRVPADPGFGPLSWVDVWLPGETGYAPGDSAFALADIEALTGFGVALVREEVSAGVLTPAQARLLRARGGTAALHLLRRYSRASGALIAAVRDVHPAERIAVAIRNRRRG